jgi:hypothetical protein
VISQCHACSYFATLLWQSTQPSEKAFFHQEGKMPCS